MTRAHTIAGAASLAGMTPRCVSVVWGLSAGALRRARPDLLAEGEGSGRMTLRVLIENSGGVWRASAVLRDPASGLTRVLETDRGDVRVTVGDGFTHVDAEGLLTASFRSSDGAVVYARTPVLDRLALGGGRYA
ncbi:MAG: hypothetical protein ACF8Q5_08540, partial [Phycisphaerales bacterium JB040]